ncbi:MAG: hypothetical protein EP343_03050 [Deltaproteobacteria bacterium]|nr:MAG: hypothetical protein EP343_03050 [Deltaproteobacteria bacterium]
MTQESQHWLHTLPIESWVEQFGTPLYVYSLPTLRARSQEFREVFGPDVSLYVAMKANPNFHLHRLLQEESLVDGVDVASLGEWSLAREAGWSASQLSYTGPGKTKEHLSQALQEEVGVLCIESLDELEEITQLALDMNKPVKVMLRLNPPEPVHAFGMQISGRPGPFGIDLPSLPEAISHLKRHARVLEFKGVHVHAGSQCFSAKAYARSIQEQLKLVDQIEESGLHVSTLNVGGGLGLASWVPYKTISLKGIASHLRGMLAERNKPLRIRLEPGRWLLGPTGAYVSRVVRTKTSYGQTFCIMDGGIHHLYEATLSDVPQGKIRPWIENLSRPQAPLQSVDVCGSLCTTRDRLGRNVALPQPQKGDLLAWPNTGAYGLSASPLLFLGHDTPMELLFDGEAVSPIRRRFRIQEWS